MYSIFFLYQNAQAKDLTLRDRISKGVQIGAHRGGNLSGRGNTMAQFHQAAADGADILETDLQLSKDGFVVIFHDKNLSKNTNCFGKVKDFTWSQLKSCRFNSGDPIPLYEDLLIFSNGKYIINAEFKDPEVIEPAIQVMKKYEAYEWTYFQTQELKSNYERARQFDKNVYLIYFATNENDLNWSLRLKDKKLLFIELGLSLHKISFVQAVANSGRFASAQSFQVVSDQETSGIAGCHVLLRLGFPIIITDQTKDCIRQRDEFD